ncbi:MAG: hypothetical protein KatS3mg093_395 [Candidatus Parcubacteria bacterium]|nr:MAG: hypothetical protein KatS3mg093_395 [Candidatus Parcubacteria bacterium]
MIVGEIKMRKKIILVKHNDSQLANQLWVHISVYAYCLEKGYEFDSYKFYEYAEYFNFQSKNFFVNMIFYKTFPIVVKLLSPLNFLKRRLNFYLTRKLFKIIYLFFYAILEMTKNKQFIYAGLIPNSIRDIYFLPPTQSSQDKLLELEQNSKISNIYFSGWLFRNPVGIKKYRQQILEFFKPKDKYLNKIDEIINELTTKYEYLVGVHLRQKEDLFDGDWQYENDPIFYFTQNDYDTVNKTFSEFRQFKDMNHSKVCFIVCSNGYVDFSKFSGFNVYKPPTKTPVEDLWLLSKTNVILGCQSSFSALAATLGDIPLILISKNIDWDYYKDKRGYFQNKYFVQGYVFG